MRGAAARAQRRAHSRTLRTPARLTRMPRSKSASAAPETTAARWKIEAVSGAMARAANAGSEMSPASVSSRGSFGSSRERLVGEHEARDLLLRAVGAGERAAREQGFCELEADEAAAPGDDDSHGTTSSRRGSRARIRPRRSRRLRSSTSRPRRSRGSARRSAAPACSMVSVPSMMVPQLMSMSSSWCSNSGVLVASLSEGAGLQP